jgi:hypothetical protein
VRSVLCLVVIGCAVAQGTLASAAERPQRTIPCRDHIDTTRFPYFGDSRPRFRSRLVLGAVSVPPAYLRAYQTLQTPWRYFAKHGMVVKGGTSVTSRFRPRGGTE